MAQIYTNGSGDTVVFAYHSNGPGFSSGTTAIGAIVKIIRALKRRSSPKLFLTWTVAPGGRVTVDGAKGIGDEKCIPTTGQRVVYVI